jgi:hypothetical protein
MPRNWPALKGRDKPLDTSEATVRGGQRLVIPPLQGLIQEKNGVSFATQAVDLGFVSSPLWGLKHPLRGWRWTACRGKGAGALAARGARRRHPPANQPGRFVNSRPPGEIAPAFACKKGIFGSYRFSQTTLGCNPRAKTLA